MYLYVTFFNEDSLFKGRFYLSGDYLEAVKEVFPDYEVLNKESIDGCIGILKGKKHREKNCFSLRISSIKADNDLISFLYDIDKELDITNEFIDKSLYKYARRADWIDKERQYYPIVCIVEKKDFDDIRKGTGIIRKVSSFSAKIDQLKAKSDWAGICNIYEPLESIREKEEVWNNVNDLYNLAFACSKLGEPKNGMERDKNHLAFVKRYRDLSIQFYKRCCELEPNDYRYFSAMAYRHYLNVIELTKPRGRRDGKAADEISEARIWFDKALSINPNSIKDNYRKGKLIIDKQIDNFKYNQKEWTSDTFEELNTMEQLGITCLERVIEQYENHTFGKWENIYLNEYVKTLYCLGCYYIEKPEVLWNEYACCKMHNINYYNNMTKDEMNYYVKAKHFFEKCFNAETIVPLDGEINPQELANLSKEWAVSPIDKLYRLGLVNLHMFFVKHTRTKHKETAHVYGKKAEKFFRIAKEISDEYRKLGIDRKNRLFINEKLAWYYIFTDRFDDAIRLIERARESYIKNTYAIALMLSNAHDKYQKAETALKSASSDNSNKAKDTSKALLAHLYKLSGQEEKYEGLIKSIEDSISNSGKKLLAIIE
jgi:hypothetical protein